MDRLAGLCLVLIVLAGCTAPVPEAPPGETPAPSEERIAPGPSGEAASPPASAPPTADLSPSRSPSPSPPPPPPPAGEPAAEAPPGADEPPPAEPASGSTAAPPSPSPGPGPASPAVEAALAPVLRIGDRWTYTGVNLSGGRYDEVRTVVGLGNVSGIATYVLNVTLNGAARTIQVTRDGLNTVNETGVVTELLRFPLAVGKNWSFHWEQRVPIAGGATVKQAVHGEVRVLAEEKVRAAGTAHDAFRIHANITSSVGTLAKWTSLEVWYAPAQKAIVRAEQLGQNGQQAWSDLVQARFAPAA